MAWRVISAKEEAARDEMREERNRNLARMREYLRLPLEDFLCKLSINETSPTYDEMVAIWRGFHED
jgi:hypothetical protein